MTTIPDRDLALEIVRATESGALAASRLVGRGDKIAADQAAVDGMRALFDTVNMDGIVVIGEGEKDEAPMLYNGEHVGDGSGPEVDIAVDPLEGTTLAAKGMPNALSVVAISARGSMFDPGPCVYMEKLAGGPDLTDLLSLTDPIEDVMQRVAERRGVALGDLMVVVLDRPRHAEMITRIREAGGRIRLISDGDVSGALLAVMPDTGVDLLWGIGGTPEGVLSAAAIRCVGGTLLGRLWPRDDEESAAAVAAGYDLERVLTTGGSRRERGLLLRRHRGDRRRPRARRALRRHGRDHAVARDARALRHDPHHHRAPSPREAARAHGRSLRMSATIERAMAVEVDQRVRIAAPPERVWRALTDLVDLRRWLFPSAEADVRDGGFWRFTFPHWPSARGLHHPALNFGGPIVELVPGRVLGVQFEPPYWGVLRFELAADGDGTELRVTQRGFEGNEDWLADFRGGWGSFNDRLALLCEIGETATPRHIEPTLAAWRALEPAELAAALAQLAGHDLPARPYWHADGGRIALVVPGAEAGNGYQVRREEACDALTVVLPPSADLDAARASLERSLPRRGWTAAGPLRAAVDPAHPELGCELALPYRPAVDRDDPEPFVRAFERAFCAPGTERRRRRTSRPAARSRSPAALTRGRSIRRSRACPPGPWRASGACA